MVRRLVVAAVALPLVFGTASVFWAGLDGPPVAWVLAHGLPGAGGPTGKMARVAGLEFVEIGPGYFRMGRPVEPPPEVARRLAAVRDREWRITIDPFPLWYWGERIEEARVGNRVLSHLQLTGPPSEGLRKARWERIPRPYWIARTEMTRAALGAFPRAGVRYDPMIPLERRGELPVGASYEAALEWCAAAAAETGLPMPLPTEAEWERACGAGSTSEAPWGGETWRLAEYAWYSFNSGGFPQPVATRNPNRWGLFDMQGNVAEWCDDGGTGTSHAARGGSIRNDRDTCVWRSSVSTRSYSREPNVPGISPWPIGFRPAFSLPPGGDDLVRPYLVRGGPAR